MSPPDALSERGAKALAERITLHWSGYAVRTWVETEQAKNEKAALLYVVRSDLVNGLPRELLRKHGD